MVLVLKTSVMKVTVGSNPTLSGFFWRCGQVVRQRIANSSLPSSNLGAAYVFCKNNFLIYSKSVVPELRANRGLESHNIKDVNILIQIKKSMKKKFKLSIEEVNLLNTNLACSVEEEQERFQDSTKASLEGNKFCIQTSDKVLIEKINNAIMQSFIKKPYDEEILMQKIGGEKVSVSSWENSSITGSSYCSILSSSDSTYYSIILDPQNLEIRYKAKPHTYKIYTKKFEKLEISLETNLDSILICLTQECAKSEKHTFHTYKPLELLSNEPVQVQVEPVQVQVEKNLKMQPPVINGLKLFILNFIIMVLVIKLLKRVIDYLKLRFRQ